MKSDDFYGVLLFLFNLIFNHGLQAGLGLELGPGLDLGLDPGMSSSLMQRGIVGQGCESILSSHFIDNSYPSSHYSVLKCTRQRALWI